MLGRQGSLGAGEPAAFAPQWMKEKPAAAGVGAEASGRAGAAFAATHPLTRSLPPQEKPSQSPQPQKRPEEKPWVADRWGSTEKESGQDTKWGSTGETSFGESRLSRWATEDERQRVQPPRGREPAR